LSTILNDKLPEVKMILLEYSSDYDTKFIVEAGRGPVMTSPKQDDSRMKKTQFTDSSNYDTKPFWEAGGGPVRWESALVSHMLDGLERGVYLLKLLAGHEAVTDEA
jgi:hypothetical protein